jgi:hypothetical protein
VGLNREISLTCRTLSVEPSNRPRRDAGKQEAVRGTLTASASEAANSAIRLISFFLYFGNSIFRYVDLVIICWACSTDNTYCKSTSGKSRACGLSRAQRCMIRIFDRLGWNASNPMDLAVLSRGVSSHGGAQGGRAVMYTEILRGWGKRRRGRASGFKQRFSALTGWGWGIEGQLVLGIVVFGAETGLDSICGGFGVVRGSRWAVARLWRILECCRELLWKSSLDCSWYACVVNIWASGRLGVGEQPGRKPV